MIHLCHTCNIYETLFEEIGAPEGTTFIVKNIFFSEYTSDTFNDNVNTEIYHEIFKDYIAEKSNKIEVI